MAVIRIILGPFAYGGTNENNREFIILEVYSSGPPWKKYKI
jgi:hypothetical protein